MKINFIENLKVEKSNVLIGKTGFIRFKKCHIDKYKMAVGQRFLIGYDEEETKPSHLYILPSPKCQLRTRAFYDENSF